MYVDIVPIKNMTQYLSKKTSHVEQVNTEKLSPNTNKMDSSPPVGNDVSKLQQRLNAQESLKNQESREK
jgi:hypothetical protein